MGSGWKGIKRTIPACDRNGSEEKVSFTFPTYEKALAFAGTEKALIKRVSNLAGYQLSYW